jgi:hypothetical protein
MWEPQLFATLRASTGCMGITLRFTIVGSGVQTWPTRHVGHFWPLVLAPGDCEDGEFAGMKIGRGNPSTRREPAPAPLYLPQIPLDQTRVRTRTSAVGSLCDTWCVYYTTWAHLNFALHKFLPSLIPAIQPLQLLISLKEGAVLYDAWKPE